MLKNNLLKSYKLLNRREKYYLLSLVFLATLNSFLELIGISYLQLYINSMNEEGSSLYKYWDYLGVTDVKEVIFYGALVLFGIYLLKNVYYLIFFRYKTGIIYNMRFRLEVLLYKTYLHSPYNFILNNNSAFLFRNINSEVNNLVLKVILPVIDFTIDMILAVSIITLLMFNNFLLTLIIIVFIGAIAASIIMRIKSKIKALGKEDHIHNGLKTKAVFEGIGAFKDIKILGRENFFISIFIKSAKKLKTNAIKLSLYNSTYKPIIETLAILTVSVIIIVSIKSGSSQGEIFSTVVLFGVALLRLMPSINSLMNNLSSVLYKHFFAEIIYSQVVESKVSERILHEDKVEKASTEFEFHKQIEIKDLSFKYESSPSLVLNKMNLTIEKGKAIGIVGRSGSGKSTLVDILMGLYDEYDGKVLVDDSDIKDDIRRWRSQIGYVPQNIFLLDNTMRRNIAFGIPDSEINEEQLKTAIKYAHLDELIASLDDGIETQIGEKGLKLSGGQRQRIGIARALYHNPEILIFDEATSALDNLTEKYIVQAINEIKGRCTMIIIAHRLTTVEKCDEIIMLRDGKITDRGDYNYLSSHSSEFKELATIDQ